MASPSIWPLKYYGVLVVKVGAARADASRRARGGPHNVNALHPGIVAGDRMNKLCREKAKKRGWTPEQVYQEYLDEMALRRVTVSRDIANAALFLAPDESSNMTGQSRAVTYARRRRGRAPICRPSPRPSSSIRARASIRSAVSNPSVNHA